MLVDVDRYGLFRLNEAFLEPYASRDVPWGFGALSWVVFKRTYARDGEEWWQTCRRVIEGTFSVQRAHCLERGLAWNERNAQYVAEEAFERMWSFKWTPPGRGLWIMGTRFLYERGGEALNNCGFISTKDLAQDYSAPFEWMMCMSMLGVGVGFDTRGKGAVRIHAARRSPEPHVIEDTREGWAAALRRLLRAFIGDGTLPSAWDTAKIRPAGAPLDSFGGYASGPEPLRQMLDGLDKLYTGYADRTCDAALIVDTMNLIGRCVVAGGVRHSAQIALGDPHDSQFLDLKLDPEKAATHRWASNNSVFAEVGMDYAEVARRTVVNGEPGYLWLDNARAHGRMGDDPKWADEGASGTNPCVEQTLWDHELCCLVETYPARHESLEDFRQTLRVAFLYAKTVTLVPTRDERTRAIMEQNRRIGCSMTGVVQAINRFGYRPFLEWCQQAYAYVQHLDREYSDWLEVPHSIKTTSVKPSGTVSLLAGATPGVHWDHAPYYIRRVRVGASHPLTDLCRRAGYTVEPSVRSDSMAVIEFPVHVPGLKRCRRQVSLWEKVDLAAQMQRYWSDNQVSCTADFSPESGADEIVRVLSAYEDRLKAIAFVPAARHGYPQPPYEEISREQYETLVSRLKPLEGEVPHERELEARFCDVSGCEPA